MSEPIKNEKANSDQRSNYLILSLRAENAIIEAIGLLKTVRTLHADENESRVITVQIADLEAKRTKIHADRLAFIAEELSIRPPTSHDVDTITQLAKEVDKFIVNANIASDVIEATTKIVNMWAKTQA